MSVLTMKALRDRAGLSVNEAAAKLGVGPSAIRAWETGRYKVAGQHLALLVVTYGCTEQELEPYKAASFHSRGRKPNGPRRHQLPAVIQPKALEPRQKGKTVAQARKPAKIEVTVQADGSVALAANWQPGTPQGDRAAGMAAEMLFNIR